MDEVLDVVGLATDFGVGSVFRWLLGLLGILLVVVGVALWLATDVGVLLPGALVAVGVLLLVAPVVVLFAVDLL